MVYQLLYKAFQCAKLKNPWGNLLSAVKEEFSDKLNYLKSNSPALGSFLGVNY